jgi:serine/threonine-protein kinase RsbW
MREPVLAIVSTDPTAPVVSLKIPAKAEYITLSRLALTGLARWASLSDETLSDLKLALSEACSNSVRHAYRDGRDGFVEIHYEVRPDAIAIEVLDDGSGFESGRAEDADGDLSEGGLGIAIIRAVTDEFEVGRREECEGVRLRFAKRLPA